LIYGTRYNFRGEKSFPPTDIDVSAHLENNLTHSLVLFFSIKWEFVVFQQHCFNCNFPFHPAFLIANAIWRAINELTEMRRVGTLWAYLPLGWGGVRGNDVFHSKKATIRFIMTSRIRRQTQTERDFIPENNFVCLVRAALCIVVDFIILCYLLFLH
jgi:hypothetical protein